MLVRIFSLITLCTAAVAGIPPEAFETSLLVQPGILTKTAEPNDIKGYRLAAAYHPAACVRKRIHLFFDAAFAHYTTHENTQYHSISIASVAPVLRAYFKEQPNYSPYVELSFGPSYASSTHFGHQELGIRYAFQDRGGLGVAFGQQKAWTLAVQLLHYSNANLAKKNNGFTAPLTLQLGFTPALLLTPTATA